MDALTGFLQGPRARGAFLMRSVLDPPWSLRIQDRAPLTVAAVVHGSAWLLTDDGTRQHLQPGDVILCRGPEPYTVADDPDTAPQVIIHPGQICTTPDGRSLTEEMTLGLRTWGNSAAGSTVLLTGTYQGEGEISRRLVDALPQTILLRADEWDCPYIALLAEEIGKDELGQEAVLDRLLDLLVVATLRTWFAREGAAAPSWYRAHTDPIVGAALRLLHNEPARAWTVVDLAREVGASRAALARRFTDLVGEPPIAFLTAWRLTLAADLLQEPDATVGRVARQIGYGNPFTFSTAFKRRFGRSPQQHRKALSPAPLDLDTDVMS